MPYIRYLGRMYNALSGEYIDETSQMYTFDRYIGDQLSNITTLENRNDINWSGYYEGETTLNVGMMIEYYAKKLYYESGLTTWPILRIMTSDSLDDFYLEWKHDSPMSLLIKANNNIEAYAIPFIWEDTIDLYDGEPRFNTVRAHVFTTVRDKEELLTTLSYYCGSFAPNDTTGAWFTRVQPEVSVLITNAERITNESAPRVFSITSNKPSFFGYIDWLNTINFDSKEVYASLMYRKSTYQGGSHMLCFVVLSRDGGIYASGSFNGTAIQGGGGATHNEYELVPPGWYFGASRYIQGYSGGGTDWSIDSSVPYVSLESITDNWPVPLRLYDFINNFGLSELAGGSRTLLYDYLSGEFITEPPSDVDPEDIPPEDEPVIPIPPDGPDPYYDPESDPTSPQYDPRKDPGSQYYDPTIPATPYQPTIHQTIIQPAPIITPPSPVPAPETPPTYVNTSRLFTIFTPTISQLTDFANFLWASPTDIVPTFRKIVANPMDCVLGLMVIPQLSFTRQSRELNIGNIGTGITMDYAPSQFVDFDCGQLFLQEYYRSYLDYSPYTKLDIFLPFIGTRELSIDECMQKTIGVTYRFDLATGTCVAFIKVNGTVLYQFEGNCASHIPLSSADWGSTVKAIPTIAVGAIKAGGLIGGGPVGALGIAAAASVMSMKERHPHAGSMSGSAGLMGVLYPYLIVTRPCQALPESQNSFTGYPSFITMSLGDCSGYTEVEQVHLEHVPATGEELIEIERLLKEGVLF
mgnify:CR=1 FL=1